jgi:hypothetical protein
MVIELMYAIKARRVAQESDSMKTGRSTRPLAEKLASKSTLEDDISIHIFTTSATMVGVCLTVIGVLRVVLRMRSVSTWADDLLSIDALLFLSAGGVAYWALRTRSKRRRLLTEKIADVIFLFALTLMTSICALITYTIV